MVTEPRVTKVGVMGRPVTSMAAKRVRDAAREKAQVRLWRAAPRAVKYLNDVIEGAAEYHEGKYKACVALLSRTLPTITSQSIQADSTAITATVVASGDAVLSDLAARTRELERHFGRPILQLLGEGKVGRDE